MATITKSVECSVKVCDICNVELKERHNLYAWPFDMCAKCMCKKAQEQYPLYNISLDLEKCWGDCSYYYKDTHFTITTDFNITEEECRDIQELCGFPIDTLGFHDIDFRMENNQVVARWWCYRDQEIAEGLRKPPSKILQCSFIRRSTWKNEYGCIKFNTPEQRKFLAQLAAVSHCLYIQDLRYVQPQYETSKHDNATIDLANHCIKIHSGEHELIDSLSSETFISFYCDINRWINTPRYGPDVVEVGIVRVPLTPPGKWFYEEHGINS